MRVVLSILACIFFLKADVVSIYRTQGLAAVEEYIQNQLQNYEYWSEALAKQDVKYGYYEDLDYLIHAQKSKKELRVYKIDNNKFENIFTTSVLIGKGSGDKQQEGDLKTPVGAYFFTERKTELDPFYGPLALVTSYPNGYDVLQNKNGGGIWIHGMPSHNKRDDFTKGCIALENDQLVNFDKLIDMKRSALLISENNHIETNLHEISVILSRLYEWRSAWRDSDIELYISFYSDKFRKIDGMNFEEFKKYKQAIFSKNEEKKIIFSKINVMPYPNILNKKMFKISYLQNYQTKNHKSFGPKELYVELIGNNIFILAES